MDQLNVPLLLLICTAILAAGNAHKHGNNMHPKMAKCTIAANTGDPRHPIEGVITFTQGKDENVTIHVHLQGFNATDGIIYHGFHIHQKGDTGNKCKAAGGHYNPTGVEHGGPMDAIRHVGDLGHLMENGSRIDVTFTDHVINLEGAYSILNRAVVVHEKEDDMGKMNNTGSRTTGNAGKRLGCCVIEAVQEPDPSGAHRAAINSFMVLATLMFIKLMTTL